MEKWTSLDAPRCPALAPELKILYVAIAPANITQASVDFLNSSDPSASGTTTEVGTAAGSKKHKWISKVE